MPSIRINLNGSEKQRPSLQEFVGFFDDFNFIYSQLRMALDENTVHLSSRNGVSSAQGP